MRYNCLYWLSFAFVPIVVISIIFLDNLTSKIKKDKSDIEKMFDNLDMAGDQRE